MKILISFVILLLIYSCQGNQERHEFPPAMYKILTHHGGLTTWQKKETLRFQILTPDGIEAHYVDLKTNRDRVEGPGYMMGYDGKAVWVSTDTTFDGNPAIYHNLYSFFFSMPFLLADKGLQFSDADPISFGGLEYPGIKVIMGEGASLGFGKEYFIHYNPLSYRMAWLGYSVNKEIEENIHRINWVRYDDWDYMEKLILPKSISWYKFENGEITEPKHEVVFDGVEIGWGVCRQSIFEKPEGAAILEQ